MTRTELLERQQSGSIDPMIRLQDRLGSAAAVERLHAEGNAAFYRNLAVEQLRIIRARRGDGSFYPGLIDDLGTYRDGWHRWLKRRTAARGIT